MPYSHGRPLLGNLIILFGWLYDASAIGVTNLSSDMLDSWTPDNKNASMPSLNANNTGFGSSDRYLKVQHL